AIAAHSPDGKLDPIKVRQELAETNTRVGVSYLRFGEPRRAAGYFQDALKIREELAAQDPRNAQFRLDAARAHVAVAEVRFRARDWPAARDHVAQAVTIEEQMHREQPRDRRNQFELANALGNLGVFALRSMDLAGAERDLSRSGT